MSSSDLIMKSIENMILYGIDLQIRDEDSNEYLFEMCKFINDQAEELVASMDIDAIIVEVLTGEHVCNISIKAGVLKINPSANEYAFTAITFMLEFISTKTELFEQEEIVPTEQEETEEDSDEFEWI